MESAGEALWRAILAEPDEDMPRLVYADWLEENGQTLRAEFIRAQIEAVRADPFGPKARAAAKRANELLTLNQLWWIPDHLPGVSTTVQSLFERGFISHVEVANAFIDHAASLFKAYPIESLTIDRSFSPPDDLGPIFELPQLRQLRRLRFRSNPQVEGEYEILGGSPHLGGLRDLSLSHNPIPPAWLDEVLRGKRFPGLTGLDLAEAPHLGPCLASALPAAAHRRFKRMNLAGVVFSSDQIQQVLVSRCLREVEELHLACVARPDDTGPLYHLDLGYVIPWERLVILNLDGQRLGNEGVREIVGEKEAGRLRWLSLANNQLGPEAIRYLVNSKYLALNYLDLTGNGFAPGDLVALRERFPDAVILPEDAGRRRK